METRMLAAVRAADRELLYSLYYPAGGRAPAAAVVGCVCLDYLRCSECERILGQSFLAVELAVRKKQRTDPPVLAARVGQELGQGGGPGSHGAEGSDAALSGMAHRVVPGSHPPSDGAEGSAAAVSGMPYRLVPGSHPPSDGAEGSDAAISTMAHRIAPGMNGRVEVFEAAISGMTARLGLAAAVGERAKEVFRRMERANAWHYGRGWTKDLSKGLAYAACLSIACSTDGLALSPRELARAAAADGGAASPKDIATLVAHIKRRLGEEEAAGRADRLVPGSDGVEWSGTAVSSMVDRLWPDSHPPSDGDEGFEAAISGMAARLGLPAAVGERGKEVFRKMEEASAWPHGPGRSKFRSNAPLVYAACLSTACHNEDSARSLRELALAAAGDGGPKSMKEIARLVSHIRSQLEEAGQLTCIGMVSVSSFLRRFSAYIGLAEAEETVALEAARRLEEGDLDVPHSPWSVAAAIACLTLERAGAWKPGKDVAAATGVSDMTIYMVCRKLRPHAELLFG
ncbi:hypothetical protein CFC21_024258 [Triticum aestivum]|uniref:Transcription factor TFIIB cyclin-like domain-containing protein n=2 Tax=Triticum aestivum TaxID=4565 RepID=A0A9R1EFV6_WHEAT|nr:hypothetical protein CFC21_024258 [Triticum aestivum]